MSPAAISSSGDMRVSVSCSPPQREQPALQHIAVIGSGFFAEDQQDQPAHDQRQDNGNQHADQAAPSSSPSLSPPGGCAGTGLCFGARRSCRFGSGHQQADLALHILAVLDDAGEAALEHDADAVAELQQLVEVGGDRR